jgi:hypothetical protein
MFWVGCFITNNANLTLVMLNKKGIRRISNCPHGAAWKPCSGKWTEGKGQVRHCQPQDYLRSSLLRTLLLTAAQLDLPTVQSPKLNAWIHYAKISTSHNCWNSFQGMALPPSQLEVSHQLKGFLDIGIGHPKMTNIIAPLSLREIEAMR